MSALRGETLPTAGLPKAEIGPLCTGSELPVTGGNQAAVGSLLWPMRGGP